MHALKLVRMTWWEYVQRVAGTSSPTEIGRRARIGQSSVGRWHNSSPKPENVVAFARAYDRPPLEAFVAAKFLTEEEAGLVEVRTDSTELTHDALVDELHRIGDELRRRISN